MLKKLLFLFFLIPSLVYAQGGGAGAHITSEAQHPLRHNTDRLLTDTSAFDHNLSATDITVQQALETIDELAITGAPSSADYLVGTANGTLSAEIVVGTTPNGDLGGTWDNISVDDDSHAHTGSTLSGIDISNDTNLTAGDALTLTDDDIDFDGGASPGGELGGTWASPTVDATHSGSAHHAAVTAGTAIDVSGQEVSVNTTEINSTTFGDNSLASFIHTYDLTGTDVTVTFASNKITFSGDLEIVGDLYVTDVFVTNIDGDSYVLGRLGIGTISPQAGLDIATGIMVATGNKVDWNDVTDGYVLTFDTATQTWAGESVSALGDITSVGDCSTGACFDGTQGTTLTFNNAGGDATLAYDGTDFDINKGITVTGTVTGTTVSAGTFILPNGSTPTVSSAGNIAIDTSTASGASVRFYADSAYVLPAWQRFTFTITNPTSSADRAIGAFPANITIKHIRVLCVDGTNIIGGLDEADVNGLNAVAIDSDITAPAGTIATDDGSLTNPTIDANDQLYWHTTSVSGTVTKVVITVYYIYDQVN